MLQHIIDLIKELFSSIFKSGLIAIIFIQSFILIQQSNRIEKIELLQENNIGQNRIEDSNMEKRLKDLYYPIFVNIDDKLYHIGSSALVQSTISGKTRLITNDHICKNSTNGNIYYLNKKTHVFTPSKILVSDKETDVCISEFNGSEQGAKISNIVPTNIPVMVFVSGYIQFINSYQRYGYLYPLKNTNHKNIVYSGFGFKISAGSSGSGVFSSNLELIGLVFAGKTRLYENLTNEYLITEDSKITSNINILHILKANNL